MAVGEGGSNLYRRCYCRAVVLEDYASERLVTGTWHSMKACSHQSVTDSATYVKIPEGFEGVSTSPRVIGRFWDPRFVTEAVVRDALMPALESVARNVSGSPDREDAVFVTATLWVHEVLSSAPANHKRTLAQNVARVTLDFLEEMA